MDVHNHIFDDFSLTRKISVAQLTKIFNVKFGIEFEGAQLLARYAVEQPNFSKDDEVQEVEDQYEFDPNKVLSHAKVVSRLQSVMTTVMMDS